MLLSLQVRNLALIEETELIFQPGLTIMTGETGAGKSIIIGSINLALGDKINREMLRDREKEAYVELIFSVDDQSQRERLQELEIETEDDQVIFSRKMTETRSTCKINGETVPVSKLRDAAGIFIDIYGQKENQVLLKSSNHLEILDEYARQDLQKPFEQLEPVYQSYQQVKRELAEAEGKGADKDRELDLLQYEVEEIKNARIELGEDTRLEAEYRKLMHMQRIAQATGLVLELTDEMDGAASQLIGRACRELGQVTDYDETLKERLEQLQEIDQLINDFSHDLRQNREGEEFDPNRLQEVNLRLDLLNHLKQKYGDSLEKVLLEEEKKEKQMNDLLDYDAYLNGLHKSFDDSQREMLSLCHEITDIRKAKAKELSDKVTGALQDLNFLHTDFSMKIEETDVYSKRGANQGEFMISTNPGEALKPLDKVASGGELSRIMLALKSVVAQEDNIGTLIFDEIDTGISGRTAQKVAEKMNVIAKSHQVISITHLPQIAAMSDVHFLIEKEVQGKETISTVRCVQGEEQIEELARMLGGAKITDVVKDGAREMRELALAIKKQ